MDKPSTSGEDNQGICKLCNTQPRRYTCPKCEVPYCSLECYKSEAHLECSEHFYKDWVETELRTQEQDPEGRRKMIDILKRINSPEFEIGEDIEEDDMFPGDEDSAGSVDSDDEEDSPDLAERLQNIDLNNADQLWSALTDAERQEFEATVRNGETTKFVPSWTPWWSESSAKVLIEEIPDQEVEPDYITKCPPIVEVAAISEVTKASPYVQFNLLNVLHAYAYTVLHFNGDHLDSSREAVTIFYKLSTNMQSNKVFEDSRSAIESVAQQAIDCQSLPGDEEAMASVKQAVNLIIKGPEDASPNYYVSASLSDLHRLFTKAKSETPRSLGSDTSFSRKFRLDEMETELSRKTLLLSVKKIEYYFSWVKSHRKRLFSNIQ